MPNTDRPNILHSSQTNEHYSPPEYGERSALLMGGINLDAASCALANILIGAERFFTQEDNALSQEWFGNVFLNPPGGKKFNKSYLALFWEHLLHEYLSGRVRQAVFLAFQTSILRTKQSVFAFPMIVPKDRIHFWTTPETLREQEALKKKPRLDLLERYIDRCLQSSGKHRRLEDKFVIPSRSPSHDNILIYLPPLDNWNFQMEQFHTIFGDLGEGTRPTIDRALALTLPELPPITPELPLIQALEPSIAA